MANKTIGSVMIREIIRMKQKRFSNSKTSQSLVKSRTTILKHLSIIEVSGLKTEELLKLTEEDLFEIFEVPNIICSTNREPIHADLHAFFPYVEK
jgi:hypothetical protein